MGSPGRCARKNDTGMRTLIGIISRKSKKEYLESCRARYPSLNRAGSSAMIDEVSDALNWDRKHTIKALHCRVSLGVAGRKRGSEATRAEGERAVIDELWKRSVQPGGKRQKATIPLWLGSYKRHHG